MGVVYRARDKVRRTEVALKSLRRADGFKLYRFKREFRSLAGIVHPNLVTLFELLSAGDEWFFTMALVDGVSFIRYVRPYTDPTAQTTGSETGSSGQSPSASPHSETTAPTRTSPRDVAPPTSSQAEVRSRRRQAIIDADFDVERLRNALAQLVDGVHALHRAGKLHRDLKPSNVLVEHSGHVVVCDFGLVQEVVQGRDDGREARIAGTPLYMSPEQAATAPLDEASDWYSVGVMLYEALTGRAPFDGSVADILRDKQSAAPPPPRRLAVGVPEDLDELCVRLLQRDPALRPTGPEILATLGRDAELAPTGATPAPELPLVGRHSELSALRQALADTRDGHSVAVFVHGPSGVGKSALVRAFVDHAARSDGALVLEGRCHARESVPYKALDTLVDALSALLLHLPATEAQSAIPRDFESLARLFPVLRRVRAVVEPDALSDAPADPQELRNRAFGAMRFMLGRLAQARPTVVFIDDLHRGDVDSAIFLRDLIHHHDAPPVLFVASYRDADAKTSPVLDTIVRLDDHLPHHSDVRDLALNVLGEETAKRLALQLLSDHSPAAHRKAEAIARESGGNPLFIAELAASIGRFDEPGPEGMTLGQAIGRRVSRLSDDARALLSVAVIAARPIPVASACRAAHVYDEARALVELQAERLVSMRTSAAIEEIETYHDQIRESIARGMSDREARRLHRRLARAIEASSRVDPIALVEHWLGAGDRDKAGLWAARAAAQAERTLAFDRAAHHYRLVLDLKEMSEDERRTIQHRLGDALAHAGRLGEAADEYLAAARGAPLDLALELRRRALEQMLRSGQLDEGMTLARAVLRDVGVTLPSGRAGTLLSILYRRAQLAIRGLSFQPRPTSEISPEALLRLDTYWSLATGLGFVNHVHAAHVRTRYLLEALRAGDSSRAALALSTEIGFLGSRGGRERKAVDRVAALAFDLAERAGDVSARGVAAGMYGIAKTFRGEFRDGYEVLKEGIELLLDHAVGARWEIDVAQIYSLSVLIHLGHIAALTEQVPIALANAVDRGDEFLATGLRTWRCGFAWLALDDPEEGRRQVAEADKVIRASGSFQLHQYFRMVTLAQIELYEGHADQAYSRVERRWRALERSMLLRIQPVFIEAHYLRGRAAVASALVGAAPDRKRLAQALRCARRIEREGMRWGSAIALILRGSATAAGGSRRAAGELFERAAERCDSTEMRLLSAVARYRLGELTEGAGGAALVREATEWMRSEKIAAPSRIVELFSPGKTARR